MTTGFLRSVGIATVEQRRRVIVVWLVVVVAAATQLLPLYSSFNTLPYRVDGSESARSGSLFEQAFPAAGSEQALLVVRSEALTTSDGEFHVAAAAAVEALGAQPGVASALLLPAAGGGPTPGAPSLLGLLPVAGTYHDPHNRYAVIGLLGSDEERQQRISTQRQAADSAARNESDGRVTAAVVGASALSSDLRRLELADLHRIEMISVPLVLVVLLLGLRLARDALLPLVIAGAVIIVTGGLFGALSASSGFDAGLLVFTALFGLGIGVDYAVFIMFRYREEIAAGHSPAQAGGIALATAGSTVVCAGVVVAATAPVLFLVSSTVLHGFALAAIALIVVTLTAVATLLPALLSLVTPRRPRMAGVHAPRTVSEREGSASGGTWERWARHLMRHPWPYLLVSASALLLVATPALGLRLGMNIARNDLAATPSGRGLAIVERDFPGGAGLVTILLPRDSDTTSPNLRPLLSALRADPQFATGLALDNGRNMTAVLVVPRAGPDSPHTIDLVQRIRGHLAPNNLPANQPVLVGGFSAQIVDITNEATDKFKWVAGLVLAICFACLLVIFRSPLLAAKAIVLNLLATAAAFGAVVAVFQHGWGAQIMGVTATETILPYLPAAVFTILFAVSTDYEMFLIRRIKENYDLTGDTVTATATALQRSARPIALAAATMIAALIGAATGGVLEMREMAFALIIAIAIDATIIRLVLVPALIRILGPWNWWMPTLPFVARSTRHSQTCASSYSSK